MYAGHAGVAVWVVLVDPRGMSVVMCTQDTLESLCELYSLLKEEDMFTAVWLKRARLSEVNLALTYEQHGFFEQAQLAYEQVTTSPVMRLVSHGARVRLGFPVSLPVPGADPGV